MRELSEGLRTFSRAGLTAALLLACALTSLAQTNKGGISGSVKDASGAVIPNASVKITNQGTGAVREVTANDEGTYAAPLLDVGIYSVEASAPGFQGRRVVDVNIRTSETQGLDFTLEAGQVAEAVTVTAEAPLVQTETSDRGSVISGREVTELPLSGRNFTQLATLTPGVTRSNNVGLGGGPEARAFNNGDPRAGSGGPGSGDANGNTENSRFSRSGGAALSVNGQRPTQNNFSLDGVDNNEPQFGTIGVFPNPDAIAEFRVTTSVPPAEVGNASGAVINTTTKSGTNDFHGSLYYYGQNSALNAYHPSLKTRLAEAQGRGASAVEIDALQKPVQQIHEFGGTLGGPIRRNRTFFFFDYLGQRNNLPFPASSTVPTLGARNGNFGEYALRDCNGDGTADGPICDPTTGQAFAGGVIPSGRIASVGRNYLNAFPAPTRNLFNPGNGKDNVSEANYFTQRANQERINNIGFKIDHRLTDNNSLTGRFNEQRLNTVRANLFPGNIPTAGFGAGEERGNSRQLVITDTHTFSPTVLNEFRFGLTQIQISIFNCGVGGACGVSPTFSQDIGIPNSNSGQLVDSGGALIGAFGTGFHEFTGDGGLFQVKSKNPYFGDTVTVIKGGQVLKFGAELRFRLLNTIDAGRTGSTKGQFQYGDVGPQTGTNANCPAASVAPNGQCYVNPQGIPFGGTGNALGDILLGLPALFVSNAEIQGNQPFDLRSQEIGLFVQDDWKVNDRLTLNLGLRYDLFLPYSEKNGRYSLYDIGARRVNVATGGGDRLVEADKNNFGPRVGFAYAVGDEKNLVLRGGYGLLYSTDGVDYPPGIRNAPFSNSVAFDQFTGNLNTRTTFSMVTGPPPVPPAVDPANLPTGLAVFAMDPEQRNTFTHQFQLSMQYQFARDWSVDVGYVGNRSRNLLYALDIGAGGTAQARNAANQFLDNAVIYTNGAESQYDALQTQLRKRLSRNVQGQVSYTWSHAIDNSTGIFNGLGEARGNRGGPINPFDLNQDRGNSSLDVRHLLSADAIIDLPFGKGQRWLNSGRGAIAKVYEGFQMNFLVYARSGFPYSVRCDNCNGANRPSLVGDPFANVPAGLLLNPAAFSTNPAHLRTVTNAAGRTVSFGNLGRNTFYGPSQWNVDMSVFKNTAITENTNFQIGFEFFNVFNHTNFTVPNNNINGGDFGQIRFNTMPGRVIQYRAKFIF